MCRYAIARRSALTQSDTEDLHHKAIYLNQCLGVFATQSKSELNMPKIHQALHLREHVISGGAPLVFDTNLGEHGHISNCTKPWKMTSRRKKTATVEIARILERKNKMARLDPAGQL